MEPRPDMSVVGEDVSFADKWAAVPKEYKEPEGMAALMRHITPKWLLNRKEAIEYVTKDLESAKNIYESSKSDLSRLLARAIKYYNTVSKEGGKDSRFYNWLMNKPSSGFEKLIDHMSAHEWAPSDWSKEDQANFNQLRRGLQGLRAVANIGRRKAGLPQIEYLTAYFPQWYENMADHTLSYLKTSEAKAELEKAAEEAFEKQSTEKNKQRFVTKYMTKHMPEGGFSEFPLQFGYIWRIARQYAKKPHLWRNPSAFRRKLHDQIKDHYNKHADELLQAVAAYDLRDGLLTAPYAAAMEEAARLQKSGEISPTAYKDLVDFMTYDIAGQSTRFDKWVDSVLAPFTKVANIALEPLNREILSPIRDISRFWRQASHLSVFGGRPKPAIRNAGQRVLLTDLYNYRDLFTAQAHQAVGYWPEIKAPTGETVKMDVWLNKQPWYQETKQYLSEAAETITGDLRKKASAWYHGMHVSNVDISARTGYYDYARRLKLGQDKNSSYYKYVQKFVVDDLRKRAQREGVENVGKYIEENSEEEMQRSLVKEGDMESLVHDAVRMTQWEYLPHSMPLHFRGSGAKMGMQFTSWIQNYYSNHLYEMGYRMLHGRDTSGHVLTKMERTRALRGLGITAAVGKYMEVLFGIKILEFLVFPEPRGAPPAMEFFTGLYGALFEDDEYKRKTAWGRAKSAAALWIPGYHLYRDLAKAQKEQSLKPALFYEERKK
jgi:hypothetical protein